MPQGITDIRVDGASGHIADLHENQDYAVKFVADGSPPNTGTTSVTVGWLPRQQQPVPPPELANVAPNGVFNSPTPSPGVVPGWKKARRLEIRVQKPNNGGELSVTQGSTRWIGKVTADVTWEFDVAP